MPYMITYSQRASSKIDIAEVATAKDALATLDSLQFSDEDVRSVTLPDGREFDVFRNIDRWQVLLRELKRAAEQETNK